MNKGFENNPCQGCPRDLLAQKRIEALESIRQQQLDAISDIVMDEESASSLATMLHDIGIFEEDDDVEGLRGLAQSSLEMLDEAEAVIREERLRETANCVGSLKLRAVKENTIYELTVCNSPQSNSEPTEPVVVNRKNA